MQNLTVWKSKLKIKENLTKCEEMLFCAEYSYFHYTCECVFPHKCTRKSALIFRTLNVYNTKTIVSVTSHEIFFVFLKYYAFLLRYVLKMYAFLNICKNLHIRFL